MAATMPVMQDGLLLERLLPEFDEVISASALVDAPAAVTYEIARNLDFLSVHSPLLDASFWVRGLPERLKGESVAPPPHLTLGGDDGVPGWSILGETPGREVAFGAVGVFWTPTISWRDDVAADEFARFDESGYGKIACNFAVVPYGDRRSVLVYECRTQVTDEGSRRKFHRYWVLVRPFVKHVLAATVRTVGMDSEARALRA